MPGTTRHPAPAGAPGNDDQLDMYARDLRRVVALERMHRRELERRSVEAAAALAAAIEARVPNHCRHTPRIELYAVGLALALGWSDEAVEHARLGALMHDVGLVGVADAVLHNPGPLAAPDWVDVRRHPDVGAGILERAALLKPAAPYARSHHEWWNGSGYPDGLSGESIPVEGRLMAVVDVFDAVLARERSTGAEAVARASAELLRGAGTQFDPALVRTFLMALADGRVPLVVQPEKLGPAAA